MPCSRLILLVRWPPSKICASLSLRKVLIQVIMSGPNPRVFSVVCMKVCDIESKAFRKKNESRLFGLNSVLNKIYEVYYAASNIVVFHICFLLSAYY